MFKNAIVRTLLTLIAFVISTIAFGFFFTLGERLFVKTESAIAARKKEKTEE